MGESQDILLIAGKGHENYQDIQGVKMPFDDLEVARNALDLSAENSGEKGTTQ